ncbi:MAG: LysR family transcriptional regulator [Burkholderiaceae bacterium]|nr:LysR family transcriptional regulator [Burkholderiaceae bacterium]
MKLRHVELIHAVVQTGSLSAAARLLNITQPAATRTLQHAEQSLGYPLFLRRGGRLRPTPELQHLAPLLRLTFDGLDDVRRAAHNLRSGSTATVRVGIVLSMAGALPQAFQGLPRLAGAPRWEFSTGHYDTLLEWLRMHEIDVGIALEPPLHPALEVLDLGRRRLVCAGRPEVLGKFAQAGQVSADQMRSMPLIEVLGSDPVGRMVATLAERHGWPFPARLAVKTHQVALDFAASGLGVAVVDDLSAARFSQALTVLPIEPATSLAVKALWLQSRPMAAPVAHFVEAYRRAIAAL